MKIIIIRGAFLNNYELQNIYPLRDKHNITLVGSKLSIHTDLPIHTIFLFSFYDLIIFCEKYGSIGMFIGKSIKFILNRTLGDSHILFGLENYIKKNGPFDIAYCAETHYYYDKQLCNLKKKKYIQKIVSLCWDIIPNNNQTTFAKKLIKQISKKYIDHYICPTKLAKTALIKENINKNKISIIQPGVDKNMFYFLPRKNIHSPIRLLFAGRLSFEKGIFDALCVVKQLFDLNIPIIFTIIGSGNLKNKVCQYIDDNNLKNIVNLNYAMYDDMPKNFQQSDIVLYLSKKDTYTSEQYGMALIESISCGCIPIAYNTGAIAEVLNGSGILVDENDTDTIIENIIKLKNDPTYYKNKVYLGYAVSKQYSVSTFSYKLHKLFLSL